MHASLPSLATVSHVVQVGARFFFLGNKYNLRMKLDVYTQHMYCCEGKEAGRTRTRDLYFLVACSCCVLAHVAVALKFFKVI